MNDDELIAENDDAATKSFDEAGELRKLIRSVKLAERYYLFFASCNQIPHQDKLIKLLKKELSEYKILTVNFDQPVKSLLDELRPRLKNEKPGAIFVTGLRSSIPGDKRARQNDFIANLNVTRDSFPHLLACPMVLWLPEYAVGKIINGAPDFFSVRSGVFFFENDEKLMSAQISRAVSLGYKEHDALFIEERRQRIENLKTLLADYQSLPPEKRDLQIEYQLKDKLADIYYKTANYTEAETILKELIADTASKDERQLASQLNNLANVYKAQGRYDEAIEKYEEALQIDEQTIGKEHPDYAIDLNNLANVYQSQGRYDEAIEKYEEALRIDEQTIGKEHSDYATCLNNLASVYESQGRYDEAIEKYEEALRIGEQTIGKEHPDYAIHLNNLASVYESQGRYDEAIEKYEEALQIDERTIGKKHPDYAIHLSNLANVYQLQGRYDEAIEKYEEALRIDEQTIGKEHPDYAIHLSNLALVYESQGKIIEALDSYREALRIFRETLPEKHPHIKPLEENIERCEGKIGNDKKG